MQGKITRCTVVIKIKYLYKIGKFQDQALIKINIASIVANYSIKSTSQLYLSYFVSLVT